MFGKKQVHHHHIDVNIEQKPHDAADAARLYGELKAKAEADVFGAKVRELGANNVLRIVDISRSGDYQNDQRRVRAIFEINGHRYDVTVTDEEALSAFVSREIALDVLGKMAGVVMMGPGKYRLKP